MFTGLDKEGNAIKSANDSNNNGLDDSTETQVFLEHAGRKFWLCVFVICMLFIFAGLLFFREKYNEMNDTIKYIVWIVGLYSGANVAQDLIKGRGHG